MTVPHPWLSDSLIGFVRWKANESEMVLKEGLKHLRGWQITLHQWEIISSLAAD